MKDFKRQIYLLLIRIIACALVFVGTTYAWVSINDVLNIGGTRIQLKGEPGVAVSDFYVYKRDGEGNTARIVSSTKNNVSIEMTEYDTIFTDRNVNTPIVIRAKILGVADGSTPHVTITCTNGTHLEKLGEEYVLARYLSNIVGIRCGYGDDILNAMEPDKNVGEVYDKARDVLKSEQLYSFATVHEVTDPDTGHKVLENGEKLYRIEFDLPVFHQKAGDPNDQPIIWIEFTYNEDNIKAYIDQHGIEVDASGEAGQDLIKFPNDISEFKFE